MKVSEPVGTYQANSTLNLLKNRVVDLACKATQVEQLQSCIEILEAASMPCTYTDEEFFEEIALSEKSGFVENQSFIVSCKEKWGVEL